MLVRSGLVSIERESRDGYLDEVKGGRMLPSGNGKYDVSRQLDVSLTQTKLLGAA